MKKHLTLKNIALAVFIIIGSFIIFLTVSVINLLFLSGSVDSTKFTTNWNDFEIAYNHNYNDNDLPDDLQLVDSYFVLSDDNNTFTYNISFKNNNDFDKNITFQLFHGEAYTSQFTGKSQNPFYSIIEEEQALIKMGETVTFSYTSVVLGDTEEEIDTFKRVFTDLYLEVSFGYDVQRIQLPVRFI